MKKQNDMKKKMKVGIGIDGQPFQLDMNKKELTTGDIVDCGVKLQVLSDEPQQKISIAYSRWKLVNWWRKITKTQKVEQCWVYSVKLVK